MDAYHYTLSQIELLGPTIFSQILDKAMEHAKHVAQNDQHYQILLIITVSIRTVLLGYNDPIVKWLLIYYSYLRKVIIKVSDLFIAYLSNYQMIINRMFISYVAKMCTTYAILWDLYIAKQVVFRSSQ